MRMSEIAGNWIKLSKENLNKLSTKRERARKKLLPIMYGDNQRTKEALELAKLRAEIDAVMAKAALDRADASRS
jgi:hypothetical protein